jgi:hypothetical protein
VENVMRRGVKGGLRKVEKTGETDDKAIDLSERGKAEDFCGVVAANYQ